MDMEKRLRMPEFKFRTAKLATAVILTAATIGGGPVVHDAFENAKASLCNPSRLHVLAYDDREYDALKDFPSSIKPPGCGDAAGLADPNYTATR